MKKFLLFSLLALSVQSSFAASNCLIEYNPGDSELELVTDKMQSFDFENFDKVCKLLKNSNAKVHLSSMADISNYQTTAIVTARISDKDLPIYSHVYYTSMHWSPERNSIKQEELMMSAVNSALNEITQEHVNSLNENRKKLGYKIYPAYTDTRK